jgi:hypothetical protein
LLFNNNKAAINTNIAPESNTIFKKWGLFEDINKGIKKRAAKVGKAFNGELK